MARDVVCGMEVDERTPPAKAEHKGQVYYFCCDACKKKFEENPEAYIQDQESHTGHHHH